MGIEGTDWTWPEVILILGLIFLAFAIVGGSAATWLEFRKTKLATEQDEQLRQLVSRYEQLAEKTMDAQQRVATDVSELRSRTSSIEQILRTVE
jgi:uncharacterized protein Yka (UPF0111/DUF47 family)